MTLNEGSLGGTHLDVLEREEPHLGHVIALEVLRVMEWQEGRQHVLDVQLELRGREVTAAHDEWTQLVDLLRSGDGGAVADELVAPRGV